MVRSLVPITALIAGSAFLMFAGGINALVLPLRGSMEGFSSFNLGLLGAGWAIGYMAGCIYVPRLVQGVGHIRTFSALAALAAITILASLLLIHPAAWTPLRAVAGFCFSGAAMIFESWLNERAEPANRGRVFGFYMMVNLVATTIGQMAITLGDQSGHLFFVLAAMFYALALIPTALTRTAAPTPLLQVELNLKELLRNSPFAVVGVFLTGVSNGAFNTLGAVYGQQLHLDVTSIALFMSVSLLAGAIFQLPVGHLSDRMDRRLVLIGLAAAAALIDLFFILMNPASRMPILTAGALFGAAIYSMYPVIVAHAYDRAQPENYLQVSGGLLLMFGAGSIAGPLLAGLMMAAYTATGLFILTLVAHAGIIAYGLLRLTYREMAAGVDKTEFIAAPPGSLTTPETAVLDPRTPDMETVEDSSDPDTSGAGGDASCTEKVP